MSQQTVVLTGANRGIGLELARRYAEQGKLVIAIVRTATPEIKALAETVVTTPDVNDPKLPGAVIEALGGAPVDLLINAAGIMHWEPLHALDRAVITRQFEVNALAPLMLSAGLADAMADESKVVFLTSRLGSLADNTSGAGYGYRISKAAVNMAARSLAVDLKPRGIAVGLIHPGSVKTSLNQLGGEIEVEDAVRGIVARIADLSIETTGSYRHQNGTALPW